MINQIRFIAKANNHILMNKIVYEEQLQSLIEVTKLYNNKYAVVDLDNNLIEGDLDTMNQALDN